MHTLKKWFLFGLTGVFFLGGVWLWQKDSTVRYGPGVLAPEAPIQENLQTRTGFLFNDYLLTPAAEFDVHARVLSRRDYKRGREAELSPVDFALGWERMSDEAVLDKIKIKQTYRFYMWQVDNFPIPRKEIETSSANMHMIPASEQIRSRMDQVKKGDIIRFTGKLVNVEATDGWRWRTSLTRNDTGNGACEIVYVENFDIVTPDG